MSGLERAPICFVAAEQSSYGPTMLHKKLTPVNSECLLVLHPMGLFHFGWSGKERVVSIDKSVKGQLKLQFLDAEIAEKAMDQLLLQNGQTVSQFLQTAPPEIRPVLREILQAIEERVGPLDQFRP